jgi:hypothetical protein
VYPRSASPHPCQNEESGAGRGGERTIGFSEASDETLIVTIESVSKGWGWELVKGDEMEHEPKDG